MNRSSIKSCLPWVVATALFMEQLDSIIVNTAVPAMAASPHVTPVEPESRGDQLHPEPGRVHPGEWLDGRSR